MLNLIEKRAGSALDQAQEYINDFQKSQFEIIPTIHGSLLAQGDINKKQVLRYFKLISSLGILIKFDTKKNYEKIEPQMLDYLNLTKKEREKSKIEIIMIKNIISLNHSFRDEFTKNQQHCIELYCDNDQILYLACYDNDQMKKWKNYIVKAKVFFEWFDCLQTFLGRNQNNLTEKTASKISEII